MAAMARNETQHTKPEQQQQAAASALEILHVDAALVVVNKPRNLLSVPGRHPDAPPPKKKRKRAGEYWEAALTHARDTQPETSLAGRLLRGVGALASIPRREDKFRGNVKRARNRVGDPDDAAVGALWRELDDAARALAAPDDAGQAPRALDLAQAAAGDRNLRAGSWSSRAPRPRRRRSAQRSANRRMATPARPGSATSRAWPGS